MLHKVGFPLGTVAANKLWAVVGPVIPWLHINRGDGRSPLAFAHLKAQSAQSTDRTESTCLQSH
jgi:hypothetical protein